MESPANRVVRQNRIRAILFFVLAGIAGLVGLLMFTQYVNRIKKAIPTATDTQGVVVAAMDMPIATRLEKRHLAVSAWPRQSLPEGSFGKMADLVGRTVRQSIVKNEPILEKMLADVKQGQGLAALLDEGLRAMAVEVNSVVGVAGFVQPGDFVDVITTMSPDEETRRDLGRKADKISKIILQNIKVLAVGEHLATQGREPVKVQVVTLAVTAEESERLALASQHGRIILTIRPRIDQQIEATVGVTPIMLLAPDQGAVAEAPKEKVRETVVVRRVEVRRAAPKEVAAPPPAAPTVEIIRGNRIEERKLRTETVPK
jgi:pilus assembly protein CpaB